MNVISRLCNLNMYFNLVIKGSFIFQSHRDPKDETKSQMRLRSRELPISAVDGIQSTVRRQSGTVLSYS